MLRERIYFAHPISLYDHPLEKEILRQILSTYSRGGESPIIVNPNTPLFQSRYEGQTSDEGQAITFNYWLGIADTCDSCIFTAFSDFSIGSGVGAEVESFLHRLPGGAPVREYSYTNKFFIIHPNYEAIKSRILTREQTGERLREEFDGLNPSSSYDKYLTSGPADKSRLFW